LRNAATRCAFGSGDPGRRNPITGVGGLLRSRRERPYGCATEQRDELAALQSIELHLLHPTTNDFLGIIPDW
jgi:hypothetical protein